MSIDLILRLDSSTILRFSLRVSTACELSGPKQFEMEKKFFQMQWMDLPHSRRRLLRCLCSATPQGQDEPSIRSASLTCSVFKASVSAINLIIKRIKDDFGRLILDSYGNYFSQFLVRSSGAEQNHL